jgi:hypothetical protein
MQSQIPSQIHVWGVLPPQFHSELTLHKSEVCRLCGLSEEYGSADGNFNREREEKEIIDELTSVLVQAIARDAAARQFTNSTSRKAGRPREDIIPYLAPELLSVYLRYHNSGGRQSVATSTDGKPGQKEAGRLFEFIKATIEPLNHYLTTELHRRPLSASGLARFARGERRRIARAIKWSELRASAKKQPSP